jgi:hypothetical protein
MYVYIQVDFCIEICGANLAVEQSMELLGGNELEMERGTGTCSQVERQKMPVI